MEVITPWAALVLGPPRQVLRVEGDAITVPTKVMAGFVAVDKDSVNDHVARFIVGAMT